MHDPVSAVLQNEQEGSHAQEDASAVVHAKQDSCHLGQESETEFI